MFTAAASYVVHLEIYRDFLALWYLNALVHAVARTRIEVFGPHEKKSSLFHTEHFALFLLCESLR